MSDRDNLIAICEHMGLKRVPIQDEFATIDDEEFAADETRVIIGTGRGYNGFFAEFTFDGEGRATEHGIWE